MTKRAHILRRSFITALGLMLFLALASPAFAQEKSSPVYGKKRMIKRTPGTKLQEAARHFPVITVTGPRQPG